MREYGDVNLESNGSEQGKGTPVNTDEIVKIHGGKDQKLEEVINSFFEHHALVDYYNSFLSELVARYTAANAIKSGSIDPKKRGAEELADNIGTIVSPFLLVFGGIFNVALKKAGAASDSIYGKSELYALHRLLEIFPASGDFELFAKKVAVKFTLKNQEAILGLNSMPDQKDGWSEWTNYVESFLTSLSDSYNVIKSIKSCIDEEKSCATLLGRMHSDTILIYLGEKDVTQEMKYTREIQPRTTKEIRRSSLRAEFVCRNIISPNAEDASQQGADTNIINEILLTASDISLDFAGDKGEEEGSFLRQNSQVTIDLDEKRESSDTAKRTLLSMCWEGCFGR